MAAARPRPRPARHPTPQPRLRLDEMPYPLATVEPNDGFGETACDSGDYALDVRPLRRGGGLGEKACLDGKLIDGRYHGLGIACFIEGGGVGPARERPHRGRGRRHRSRSMSARRRSGRASRPSWRRSRPMRSSCRSNASRSFTAPPPICPDGFGSYRLALDRDGRLRDRGRRPMRCSENSAPSRRNGSASRSTTSKVAEGVAISARRTQARASPSLRREPRRRRRVFAIRKRPTPTAPRSRTLPSIPATGAGRGARLRHRRRRRPHHQPAHAARPGDRRGGAGPRQRVQRGDRYDAQRAAAGRHRSPTTWSRSRPTIRTCTHDLARACTCRRTIRSAPRAAGEGGIIPVGGAIANAVASALEFARRRAARAAADAAARVATDRGRAARDVSLAG